MEEIYPKIQKIVKYNSFIDKIPKRPKVYTLSSINKTLKKYHKHISFTKLMKKSKNKMPKILFYKKNKIIEIQYFTYIYNGDMRFYRKYVKYIKEKLQFYLKKYEIKGIVIDLQKHSGGWMQPFIDSLSTTLLNNSSLFKFYSTKTKNGWWNIKNGKIIRSSGKYFGKFLNIDDKIKIAILISNKTRSSGEICASIFDRSLPNIKIFGSKSGGYLSVNNSYTINQDYTLHVPICYVQSVNKKIHKKEYLRPDIYTKIPLKKSFLWISK